MEVELQFAGLQYRSQCVVSVCHRGVDVGLYRADLVVEGEVIVEIKVATAIDPMHRAQPLNYLKATDVEQGLLLNFGPRPGFERLILSNDRKAARPLRFQSKGPSV